jgi:hypothetical protein
MSEALEDPSTVLSQNIEFASKIFDGEIVEKSNNSISATDDELTNGITCNNDSIWQKNSDINPVSTKEKNLCHALLRLLSKTDLKNLLLDQEHPKLFQIYSDYVDVQLQMSDTFWNKIKIQHAESDFKKLIDSKVLGSSRNQQSEIAGSKEYQYCERRSGRNSQTKLCDIYLDSLAECNGTDSVLSQSELNPSLLLQNKSFSKNELTELLHFLDGPNSSEESYVPKNEISISDMIQIFIPPNEIINVVLKSKCIPINFSDVLLKNIRCIYSPGILSCGTDILKSIGDEYTELHGIYQKVCWFKIEKQQLYRPFLQWFEMQTKYEQSEKEAQSGSRAIIPFFTAIYNKAAAAKITMQDKEIFVISN